MVGLTIGISSPSLSLRCGIYSSCLGSAPVASGLNEAPAEFILEHWCAVFKVDLGLGDQHVGRIVQDEGAMNWRETKYRGSRYICVYQVCRGETVWSSDLGSYRRYCTVNLFLFSDRHMNSQLDFQSSRGLIRATTEADTSPFESHSPLCSPLPKGLVPTTTSWSSIVKTGSAAVLLW